MVFEMGGSSDYGLKTRKDADGRTFVIVDLPGARHEHRIQKEDLVCRYCNAYPDVMRMIRGIKEKVFS